MESNPVGLRIISDANERAQGGRVSTALDIIYDYIDDLHLAGNFAEVDGLLHMDIAPLTVDVILGIMTITFAAKHKLKNRVEFMRRGEEELRRRPQWDNDILEGLH